MKPHLVLLASALAGSLTAADLRLPDPLTTTNGAKVTSVDLWRQTRRPEILELFRTHVYGRMPVKPSELRNGNETDARRLTTDGDHGSRP